MASVVKGDFTANKDGGNGNDTVQIQVPANDSGSEKTQSFVIRNQDGTKQITIVCHQTIETAQITNIQYALVYNLNQRDLVGKIVVRDQNLNLADSPIAITLYAVYTKPNGKIKYATAISVSQGENNIDVNISNFITAIDLENHDGEITLAFNNTVDADPQQSYTDAGIDYTSIAFIAGQEGPHEQGIEGNNNQGSGGSDEPDPNESDAPGE